MLEGIIIKGIGGFYYVETGDQVFECRARGIFREEQLTPLIGDKVRIRVSPEDNTGYIEEILPRNTLLIRPPVANVTQAIIVMSIKKPDINTWLLDKFLIMAEHENIDITICLNKADLNINLGRTLKSVYDGAGYNVILTSAKDMLGIDKLYNTLRNNISVFAGPSGTGKSSLLNKINPLFKLETGSVSSKTKRGKHTTRHVELMELDGDSFVLDTPGFSSLNLDFIEDPVELRNYFREIHKYSENCRFLSCIHDKEPDCAIKKHVEDGVIDKGRYNNYLLLLEEIKSLRRY